MKMSLGSFSSPHLFASKTTTQFSAIGSVCSGEGKGWNNRDAEGQDRRVLAEQHGRAAPPPDVISQLCERDN